MNDLGSRPIDQYRASIGSLVAIELVPLTRLLLSDPTLAPHHLLLGHPSRAVRPVVAVGFLLGLVDGLARDLQAVLTHGPVLSVLIDALAREADGFDVRARQGDPLCPEVHRFRVLFFRTDDHIFDFP